MRKTLHNTYPLWSLLVTVMALVSICVFTMAGFVNKASARDYVPVSYTHLKLPTTPYV